MEKIKELAISDEWHKIGKSDKYFIRRETINYFSIADEEYHIGQLIRNKSKSMLQGTLNNVHYEENFETFDEALNFLIKQIEN